jgi:hypothetical protein
LDWSEFDSERAVAASCRAEHAELKAVIAEAQKSVQLRAIFAHLDVLGANVNNKQQSFVGMPPAAFPAGIPVFTGHYHKPHTVEGSLITYIGSPFQRALPNDWSPLVTGMCDVCAQGWVWCARQCECNRNWHVAIGRGDTVNQCNGWRQVHNRFCLLGATSGKQAKKMRHTGPATYQGINGLIDGQSISCMIWATMIDSLTTSMAWASPVWHHASVASLMFTGQP